MKKLSFFFVLILSVFQIDCGEEEETEFFGEFDLVNDFDKADGMGAAAIPVSADGSDTAVWEVKNDWADTDTAAARAAGPAWPANSGLNWEQKFSLWVASLPKIDGYSYPTFSITNPQGKTITAPVLECAEVAYFLRVTFASWYNLPFFMEAVDGTGTRVFFGHFGWRTASGRYKNSNLFKAWYRDYTGGNYTVANWPHDEKLRSKKLYGANDDIQPVFGPEAHAGVYFDELFLNKRVGHFLILFLSNFGSIHLADSANTFNLKPEAIRSGDILLERWQKRGIGHTLVVKEVGPGQNPGKITTEVASGSMPRRQPKWEDPIASRRYFLLDATGGPGTNYNGEEYAKLGGGLKRWRTARAQNGYYVNTILPADVPFWISSTDYAAIAARTAQFDQLLDRLDPEGMRDALLAIIEEKRAHLRDHPASCSARTGREGAFNELYALMQSNFYMSKEEVDRLYRKFEDYVFAELVYEKSKTCCWNTTTRAMYEIIMDYNLKHASANPDCIPPVVFMNNNGYEVFREHARSLGREAEWRDWSEDESCPQRDVSADTPAATAWTDFCTIADTLLGAAGCRDDSFEENDSRASARTIEGGVYDGLAICSGDDDFYLLQSGAGTMRVTIAFTHSRGDLDLELYNQQGIKIQSSAGTGDSETIEIEVGAGTYLLRVFGYSGAANSYRLSLELP